MSNAINAAEQLRNFSNKVKPLLEAGEYLDSLGNLEQALSEARTAKDLLQKQVGETRALLNSVQREVQEAEGKVKSFNVVAEQTKQSAIEEKERILNEARAEGKKLVTDAKSIVLVNETAMVARQKESSKVSEEIEIKKQELAKLEETIRQTKARISAL